VADNFYRDNKDLKFIMESMMDWEPIIALKENIGEEECPYDNWEEAMASYLDLLEDPVGELAANRIAPRAAEVDEVGCKLVDGEVIYPDPLKRTLKELSDAQLMGMTIPREFGGLGMPETVYTAAIEIVAQADASLMNIFGLQGGIAETINEFASEALKAHYLPLMSSGEYTGAMALTEPDAGSDLAAVQCRAELEPGEDPDTGRWRINGTKRFITNGCGHVILVLARSEDPTKRGGGRGLSFFLVEKSERVTVRRIENKLGIHGSPTCELYFDNAPGYLIGKRGMGLARYTAWLMLAARLAVGAQAQGISQAALEEAEKYAKEREQFGHPISDFPQVRQMLTRMRLQTEAARAMLYAASQVVDLQQGYDKRGDSVNMKKWKQVADAMTPIAKYVTTETANQVCYESIQIHGGNGFMKEYPVERLYRDARITNIYEGTSQIQVSWAISRLVRGDLDVVLDIEAARVPKDPELAALHGQVREMDARLREALAFLKEQPVEYRELVARETTDFFLGVFVSYVFLRQAEKWAYKKDVAQAYIRYIRPQTELNASRVRNAQLMVLAP